MTINRKPIYTDHGIDFIDDVTFGDLSYEQKENARKVIDEFNKPLPPVDIVKLIARLQIIAPERARAEFDTKARTAIWVEELTKYPADIVTKVLKMRYRWFPTLAEVLDHCDTEVSFRRLIEMGIRIARINY